MTQRIAPITGLAVRAQVYFFNNSTASVANRYDVQAELSTRTKLWFEIADVNGVVSGDDAPLYVPDSASGLYYATRTGGTDAAPTWGSTTAVTFVSDLAGQPSSTLFPASVNSGTAQTIPDPGYTEAVFKYVLTGNCTFTMPAAGAGKSFDVILTQDATGSRTATFTGAKWATNGTAPTLTTTAAKTDVLRFKCRDGSTWQGQTVGLNYA
jgi:hypothetical protein